MAREDQGTSDAADIAFASAMRAALQSVTAATTIAATPAADRLLERLVRTAVAVIPCPVGSLLLIDHAAGVLTFAVAVGQTAPAVADLTVPLGRGIAGLVAVSGQPLAIANARQDPRHARDIAAQTGYLPSTILAVPVVVDGSVVGVLELLDRQGGATFSLADMELAGHFAALCAIALEQRRAETLQADLIGRALATLGGLPDAARRTLATQAEGMTTRVMADPATRRVRELAAQVATIAARGEAEQQSCAGILAAFAGYLAAHPEPGTGMASFAYRGASPGDGGE